MAIRILRSSGNTAPGSLAAGQLAYAEGAGGTANGGTLFFGEIGGTVRAIAGRQYVDKLDGVEAGAQVNVVDSVAGRTGDVVITHADLADFDAEVDARIALADIENLANVQGTPSDGQVLTWNNTGGFYEPQAAGSGVTTFVALNDTPVNFSGAGGYYLKVNSGATAVEFSQDVDDGTF
ncbi:MAG: hypothetical protein AAF810_05395 [Cyanobacteria bacterium P01_D01_bin.36]